MNAPIQVPGPATQPVPDGHYCLMCCNDDDKSLYARRRVTPGRPDDILWHCFLPLPVPAPRREYVATQDSRDDQVWLVREVASLAHEYRGRFAQRTAQQDAERFAAMLNAKQEAR